MTHFEEAAQSPRNMSITIAFCLAAYLKEAGFKELEDEEVMKGFISATSDDIQVWLGNEVPENPPENKKIIVPDKNIILPS